MSPNEVFKGLLEFWHYFLIDRRDWLLLLPYLLWRLVAKLYHFLHGVDLDVERLC